MAMMDPLAAVHQYINCFNKGDGEAMAATFAVPASILDGMAPHMWQGRQPLRIGTEMCSLKVSYMVLQSTLSRSASPCITTLPVTAHM